MCYLSAWIDLSPMHRFVQRLGARATRLCIHLRLYVAHPWAHPAVAELDRER